MSARTKDRTTSGDLVPVKATMLKRTIDRRRVILIDGGRIRIALDSTSPGRACLAIEAPGDVRIEARRLGPALDTNSEGSENTPESTT